MTYGDAFGTLGTSVRRQILEHPRLTTTLGLSLSKLVLLGESHLRAAVHEYLIHYNEERNHQGLGGQLIVPPANLNRPGPILNATAYDVPASHRLAIVVDTRDAQ